MEKIGTWVFWGLIVVLMGGALVSSRPGEEGHMLAGMSYEEEDEEVCAAGPGELAFSGEPEIDHVDVLKSVVTSNASQLPATLSPWRTVNVLSGVQAQETNWTREAKRYVLRLVGPTPLDDDATVCVYAID